MDAALPCFVLMRCGGISMAGSAKHTQGKVPNVHYWLSWVTTSIYLPTVYTFTSPHFRCSWCGMKGQCSQNMKHILSIKIAAVFQIDSWMQLQFLVSICFLRWFSILMFVDMTVNFGFAPMCNWIALYALTFRPSCHSQQ